MISWRIREIEGEINDLERKLRSCTKEEIYNIKRKIDDLKSELRRLKRREEDEEDDDGTLGMGLSLIGLGLGGFGSGGGNHGFGGGGFGGGGSGGSW
jgi:hypothetical protein